MLALDKVFKNVDASKTVDAINNIKRLEKFKARYRIKLFIDKKRDYRIGLYKHKNTIWFARILPRSIVYEENW